jgi:hypothetical protein
MDGQIVSAIEIVPAFALAGIFVLPIALCLCCVDDGRDGLPVGE